MTRDANEARRLLEQSRRVGVVVEVYSGTVVVTGPRHVADVWRPRLRRYTAELLALLAPPPSGQAQLPGVGR
ncbi:MAG TPA: hypothetical protein VKZ18_28830 [Polyangia bacterium]|nr:hypothetical protein [Polyangia bacterium]